YDESEESFLVTLATQMAAILSQSQVTALFGQYRQTRIRALPASRIYGQAVHFVNTKDNMPEATRVHLEPTINLPLSNRWGSLNT
ncbi:LPS assembly protein LptD, partial [Salmonella enterica subsp. enterica serovar Anatum]|nr:LPS assembly protein LptD [Salmonella enterica subsp. enterica serovar Anatum]